MWDFGRVFKKEEEVNKLYICMCSKSVCNEV